MQRQFNNQESHERRCWSTAADLCRQEKVWSEANGKTFDLWIHTLSQHHYHQWFGCLCGPFLLPSGAKSYPTYLTVTLQRQNLFHLFTANLPQSASLAHVRCVDFDPPHCVTVSHSSRYLTYNSTTNLLQDFLCTCSRMWIKDVGVSDPNYRMSIRWNTAFVCPEWSWDLGSKQMIYFPTSFSGFTLYVSVLQERRLHGSGLTGWFGKRYICFFPTSDEEQCTGSCFPKLFDGKCPGPSGWDN